jgi:glycosyl transferase-like sugar-binding protein
VPIPRRLHQIWLGPKPIPDVWRARWVEAHPGWQHRLWREADIEAILPDRLRPAWDHYMATKRWHGGADVGRVAILLAEGGVYVDIDSDPLRSFEGAPFMAATFFAGVTDGTAEKPRYIPNGVIGSEAGHPILEMYADRISTSQSLEPVWRTIGAPMLTAVVSANLDAPGLALMPSRTFYPEGMRGERAPGDEPIYTRHYWAGTHHLYEHQGDSPERLLALRKPRREPLRKRAKRFLRAHVPHSVRAWLVRVARFVRSR